MSNSLDSTVLAGILKENKGDITGLSANLSISKRTEINKYPQALPFISRDMLLGLQPSSIDGSRGCFMRD